MYSHINEGRTVGHFNHTIELRFYEIEKNTSLIHSCSRKGRSADISQVIKRDGFATYRRNLAPVHDPMNVITTSVLFYRTGFKLSQLQKRISSSFSKLEQFC
jgi:hypothetical protein